MRRALALLPLIPAIVASTPARSASPDDVAPSTAPATRVDATRREVVLHESAIAAAAYARSLESAKVMRASIAAFCAAPDEALLARAR